MNPFEAAEAVSHPERYIPKSFDAEGTEIQDTSLSSGGSLVTNPLENLSQLLGSNSLVNPSQATSANLFNPAPTTNVFNNNPYTGGDAPVADRPLANYNAPTSQPFYNPNTGTSRTMPEPDRAGFGVTGGKEFDFFGNRVAGGSSSDGFNNNDTPWNSSSDGSSNLDGISNSFGNSNFSFGNSDLGMSFNPGVLSNIGGGWREGGRVFDFGNKSLGQFGAETLGIGRDAYNNGRQALGMFGQFTGNKNARDLLGISGLTGNRAFDMATKGTALEYINNPLSERSLIGTALNTQGLGGLMPGLDYLQGFNSKGGLLGAGISMVNPLAGGIFNFLSPDLGGQVKSAEDLQNYNPKYNDNLGGEGQFNVGSYEAAANYAQSHGVTPDTHEFDMVVDSYRNAIRTNPSFDPMGANRATVAAEKQAGVEVERQAEVARVEAQRVEEERAAQQQRQVEAQRVEAQRVEAQRVEAQRVEAQRVEAQRQADVARVEAQRVEDARVAEVNRQDNIRRQEEADRAASVQQGNLNSIAEGETRNYESADSGTVTTTSYGDGQFGFTDTNGEEVGWEEPPGSSDSGGGGGGGGSYIATAATQALGKEGLTIFEEWRDYMSSWHPTFKTSYGRYRVTAPKIVSVIDTKDNSKGIYNYIWDMHLKPIFDLIQEDRDSTKALKDYKKMVRELQNKFLKEKA